jgi:hypothetical protein
MMANNAHNENFHPRLIIAEHFDRIENQIDIATETLLQNQSLSSEKQNVLNRLRAKKLERINECKDMNLKEFDVFDEEEYVKKWSAIMHDTLLNFKQKCDRIMEDIIKYDCILLETPAVPNGLILWLTPWFLNQKNLDFLK